MGGGRGEDDGPSDRSPHRDRQDGRELALAALCHLDGAGGDPRESLEVFWSSPPQDEEGKAVTARVALDGDARRFADGLVQVAVSRADTVDGTIREVSRRWRLERMDVVDRNVLRLAVVELLDGAGPPIGVVTSEAVRLAAAYGSERSSKFVNGVVAELAARLRAPGTGEKTGEAGV